MGIPYSSFDYTINYNELKSEIIMSGVFKESYKDYLKNYGRSIDLYDIPDEKINLYPGTSIQIHNIVQLWICYSNKYPGLIRKIKNQLDKTPSLMDVYTSHMICLGYKFTVHEDVLDILFRYNSNINITLLHCAAINGHIKLIETLISYYDNIDLPLPPPSINYSPLVRAVRRGNFEFVKFMIKSGADVNIIDKNKYTPLHHAVLKNQVLIAKLLIGHGAQLDSVNAKGNTPYNMAVILNNHDLIDLLNF